MYAYHLASKAYTVYVALSFYVACSCWFRAVNCLDGPLDLVLMLGLWSDATDEAAMHQKWKVLIQMTKLIVDIVNVHDDFVRVGLVTLGATAKSQFFVKDGYGKAELVELIGKLSYEASLVSPAVGIRHARLAQFTAASGDRSTAPNLLVILTAETTSLARDDVVAEIQSATRSGIKVYSIGTAALNSVDLTSSVAADANAGRLVSTAQHLGSVERTLETMQCGSNFRGSTARYSGMFFPNPHDTRFLGMTCTHF